MSYRVCEKCKILKSYKSYGSYYAKKSICRKCKQKLKSMLGITKDAVQKSLQEEKKKFKISKKITTISLSE